MGRTPKSSILQASDKVVPVLGKNRCALEVCFAKVVPLARTHRNSGVWICNPFSYEIT